LGLTSIAQRQYPPKGPKCRQNLIGRAGTGKKKTSSNKFGGREVKASFKCSKK